MFGQGFDNRHIPAIFNNRLAPQINRFSSMVNSLIQRIPSRETLGKSAPPKQVESVTGSIAIINFMLNQRQFYPQIL